MSFWLIRLFKNCKFITNNNDDRLVLQPSFHDNNNNNNNNAICIAQIRRKQQMGCGQCPKRKAGTRFIKKQSRLVEIFLILWYFLQNPFQTIRAHLS